MQKDLEQIKLDITEIVEDLKWTGFGYDDVNDCVDSLIEYLIDNKLMKVP